MSLNTATIHGRIGKDPELRRTQNGKAVCSFSVAVERNAKNADGTKSVDWIRCTAWSKTAELLARYFTKGNQIIVSGSLIVNHYLDGEGKERSEMVLNASNVYFCGDKTSNSSGGNFGGSSEQNAYDSGNGFAPMPNAPQPPMPKTTQSEFVEMDDDEDLPF